MYAQKVDEMHQKMQCLQPALVNRKSAIFPQNSPSSFLSLQTSGSSLASEMYSYLQAFYPRTDPTPSWDLSASVSTLDELSDLRDFQNVGDSGSSCQTNSLMKSEHTQQEEAELLP